MTYLMAPNNSLVMRITHKASDFVNNQMCTSAIIVRLGHQL